MLKKGESLTSVDFRCLPFPYWSHKVLDVRILPVAFTGSKPRKTNYKLDEDETYVINALVNNTFDINIESNGLFKCEKAAASTADPTESLQLSVQRFVLLFPHKSMQVRIMQISTNCPMWNLKAAIPSK